MKRSLLLTAAAAAGVIAAAVIVINSQLSQGPVMVPPVVPVPTPVHGLTTLSSEPPPGDSTLKKVIPPVTTGLTAAELEQLSKLQEILDDESDAASSEPLLALIRKWAAQDPAACALWCRENLEGGARLRAVGEAVGVWLSAKPEDAMAWLAHHQGEPGTEQATSLGVMHLAKSNPAQAAAWLQQYPDTGSRENWEITASQWSTVNPAAAQSYLDANLSESLRTALLPALLTAAPAGTDYDALITHYPPEVQTASLTQAAESLSHASPGTALELTAAIPDASQREALTRRIYTEWQTRDPAAAATFAASQVPGSPPTSE